VEQGVLLVFGIGVGVVAGLVGAVLALPSVPEFADQPPAPPMLYGVQGAPVLFVVAVAVAVLAAVVVASSVNLLRLSRYDQLREAPA
jgi:ABC-type antimicrobial peptide transport system permease subunit